MIGIIGAMEEEVAILKDKIINLKTSKVAHATFYQGELNGKSVVLTQSGIGKVNAAISTALLIEKFNPKYIINTGSAGALDESLDIGNVIVSDKVSYHDADATAFGYEYGQIPQMPLEFVANEHLLNEVSQVLNEQSIHSQVGLVVSGDSFIGSQSQRKKIKNQFPDAMAVEMEATAIAQTCHQFNTPFIITRAISDLANGQAEISFDEFLGEAAKSSSQTVENLLKKL